MLFCVHVPTYRLELALCEHSGARRSEALLLADRPVRGRIIELNERAYEMGARVGQTVLQASAAVPDAAVLIHDPVRAHDVWSDLLDALDALSPLVDDAGEGTAYLEMRGIEGDPQQWIARAHALFGSFGLPVRCSAGPNKFVAYAGTYGSDFESLPLRVLGIEQRIVERLHLLGVDRLGDLARLPHGPFVRRFGKAAAAWHDRARGIDPTPFLPRAHELQIDAGLYGEGSAAHEEQIVFALRVLAERVCSGLTRAGKGASLVRMSFECENGDSRTIDTGFAQATGDARTMLDLLRVKLEGVTFDAPICGLKLQVLRLEECGLPAALFAQYEPDPQAMAVALARLDAVPGASPGRARVRAAHVLEERFVYEPFAVEAFPRSASAAALAGHAIPQLRLLAVREIPVQMRGNRPVRVEHRSVVSCAGPWRIDDGWGEEPLLRDEYDVQLEDGMLCRIYRQGTHWYLRGAYD